MRSRNPHRRRRLCEAEPKQTHGATANLLRTTVAKTGILLSTISLAPTDCFGASHCEEERRSNHAPRNDCTPRAIFTKVPLRRQQRQTRTSHRRQHAKPGPPIGGDVFARRSRSKLPEPPQTFLERLLPKPESFLALFPLLQQIASVQVIARRNDEAITHLAMTVYPGCFYQRAASKATLQTETSSKATRQTGTSHRRRRLCEAEPKQTPGATTNLLSTTVAKTGILLSTISLAPTDCFGVSHCEEERRSNHAPRNDCTPQVAFTSAPLRRQNGCRNSKNC